MHDMAAYEERKQRKQAEKVKLVSKKRTTFDDHDEDGEDIKKGGNKDEGCDGDGEKKKDTDKDKDKDKKKGVCDNFKKKGKCRKGDNCPYSHVLAEDDKERVRLLKRDKAWEEKKAIQQGAGGQAGGTYESDVRQCLTCLS